MRGEPYHPNAKAKDLINQVAERNDLDPGLVHGLLEEGFTYRELPNGVISFIRLNGINVQRP